MTGIGTPPPSSTLGNWDYKIQSLPTFLTKKAPPPTGRRAFIFYAEPHTPSKDSAGMCSLLCRLRIMLRLKGRL